MEKNIKNKNQEKLIEKTWEDQFNNNIEMKTVKRLTISLPSSQLWELKVLSLLEDRAVSHQIIVMMDYYIKSKKIDLTEMTETLITKMEGSLKK